MLASKSTSLHALSRAHAAEKEITRLRAILYEVHSWIVCAAIATPQDMMQNAERIEQITNPEYKG